MMDDSPGFEKMAGESSQS